MSLLLYSNSRIADVKETFNSRITDAKETLRAEIGESTPAPVLRSRNPGENEDREQSRRQQSQEPRA